MPKWCSIFPPTVTVLTVSESHQPVAAPTQCCTLRAITAPSTPESLLEPTYTTLRPVSVCVSPFSSSLIFIFSFPVILGFLQLLRCRSQLQRSTLFSGCPHLTAGCESDLHTHYSKWINVYLRVETLLFSFNTYNRSAKLDKACGSCGGGVCCIVKRCLHY